MLNISQIRLANQRIITTDLTTPKAVVAHMGALQAQDYAMSKWAVGLRLPPATDGLIEAALDAGELVRTHVLRPTWHLVAAEDVRWMLKLTAPHIHATMKAMNVGLKLDADVFQKSNKIIEKTLANNNHLTREELMAVLAKSGIIADKSRAAHLMFNAELAAIVCNGVIKGKQHTYALMDEKVPKGLTFTREEALWALAQRYFNSHAPATLQDFQWWSGLPMGDARKGIEALKSDFVSEKINNQTYYFKPQNQAAQPTASIHFLPAFDEFLVSYKDRSASIEPHLKDLAMTSNGIFKPVIVVNGQVIGVWKREIKKNALLIDCQYFNPKITLPKDIAAAQLKPFGDFHGLEIEVI
jgi:hypothetical protein